MNEYTIEELEKTFKEHSEKSFRDFEKQCVEYFKEFNTPHPQVDTWFDLSRSLHVICKEINQLKEEKKAWQEAKKVMEGK